VKDDVKRPDDREEWLSPKQWRSLEIEEQDPLLGHLFTTTSRGLLIGDTGTGKTMLGMAWAFAMALGRSFLHWEATRPANVLYIDGELPSESMQERVDLACKWFKVTNARRLSVLNLEQFDDTEPLDTEEGQRWLDNIIKRRGPFDFIFFDNLMALCEGIMKEEESWRALLPYVLDLGKRRIGQLWMHHTGHDKSHGYGTKTREWHLDTVMMMDALTQDHPNFELKFTKSRRSKPANYHDFKNMHLELIGGEWKHDLPEIPNVGGRPPHAEGIALQALKSLGGGVTDEVWEGACYAAGISSSVESGAKRTAYRRARGALIKAGKVINENGVYRLQNS
jgi:hypothetical protein